jgi:hypothetical protein
MEIENLPSSVEDNSPVRQVDEENPVLESLTPKDGEVDSEWNVVLEQPVSAHDPQLDGQVDPNTPTTVADVKPEEFHEEGTVAEEQQARADTMTELHANSNQKKWYCRPFYLGLFLLFACILIVVIVVPIILTRPSGTSSEQIACKFINQPSLSKCRATDEYFTVYTPPGTTIPTEIGLLTQLTSLSIYENVNTGTIPSEIGLLTLLVFLAFSDTNLKGTIPSTIGNLVQLTYLEFSNSKLTGSIPPSFEGLVQLNELYFASNPLSGSLPLRNNSLTNLEYLSLHNTSLTGSIPDSFCMQAFEILIDCSEIECTCCNTSISDDDSVDKAACP